MSLTGISRVPCAHDEAAMSGPPKAQLVLTETEREELVALTLRRKTAQAPRALARLPRPHGYTGIEVRRRKTCLLALAMLALLPPTQAQRVIGDRDCYIQRDSSGPERESNWLPRPRIRWGSSRDCKCTEAAGARRQVGTPAVQLAG
jgi:hypothetical protein